MIKKWMMVLCAVLSVAVAQEDDIKAQLKVEAATRYIPSIVVEDVSANLEGTNIGRRIAKVLVGDLKVSAHFKAKEGMASSTNEPINYLAYKKEGVDLVLKLRTFYELQSIVTEARLFDVNLQQEVLSRNYTVAETARYPFIAHKAAVDINDHIKAPSIAWMQRFVIFSKYTDPAEAEVIISDYTLTFQKTVVTGGLNIFPKWANARQTGFYYTAYEEKIPTLYRIDLYSGEKTKITESPGMLVCSDVSSDGSLLLLTMAPQDQPDIFLYDTASKSLQRLTTFGGIDVSGHFIDEENRIVFVSDRLGYPNIFAKKIDSRGIEQLVYHGRNNNAVSSHGNNLVYSSRESDNEFQRNTFNLYFASTESDYVRRLTAAGVNQFPKFSHDGESVLFVKHYQRQSALGIVRLNYNKSFLFPLNQGKIQSIDW